MLFSSSTGNSILLNFTMNKTNYIESSSKSKKSKRPEDVDKRKRFVKDEVSDGMYSNIYYLLYIKKNKG